MKTRTRNATIAYRKGVDAGKKRMVQMKLLLPECPYGERKPELSHWFWAGYHDFTTGDYDRTFYKAGKKELHDETDENRA